MTTKTLINTAGILLDLSEPVVMGIINVTPDSFFPGSRTTEQEKIAERIGKVISEGAKIIDIGGYSSRPGAEDVSPEEEFRRVAKAFKLVRETDKDIAVSVDTFRAEVVKRSADEFGAFIVNDISGGEADRDMVRITGELKLPYIAMHMRGTPKDMQQNCVYDNVTAEVIAYFAERIDKYYAAGITDIIVDPGFGFAKTVDQNFELMSGLADFKILGLPVLAGISRKTMIWKTLETTPDKALNGTTALNWECLRQGASILRVHDVDEAVETVALFKKYKENFRKR